MIVYMYSTQPAKSHLASCVCVCVSTSPVDACYPIQYNLKRPGEELLGGSGGGGGGGGSAVNFPDWLETHLPAWMGPMGDGEIELLVENQLHHTSYRYLKFAESGAGPGWVVTVVMR